MIRAILTDIEGTTTSISFVVDVLFPYAYERMADFVAAHGDEPEVKAQLDAVRAETGEELSDAEVVATLRRWIDEDRKATPLKNLQGMLWEAGYHNGDFTGHVYTDAVTKLREWHKAGLKLYVYSSGSVKAQQLIFGFSDAGDLTPLFSGYFDTRIGHKREADAYRAITDTEIFDQAIATAAGLVDLKDTLIVVTSDHGHVFNIGGYPLRPRTELPYQVSSWPADYANAPFSGILNVVYGLNSSNGTIGLGGDANGVPYTILSYGNGPGFRQTRTSPLTDPTPGWYGLIPNGPNDPAYLQEAAVPMGSDTHSGEDQPIYAIGRGSSLFTSVVWNREIFDLMRKAAGL